MKRKVFLITAIFIVFCLTAYANDDNIAVNTVTGLGIMDEDNMDKTVTRGEFARIIRLMCRLELDDTEWQKDFFGNGEDEMKHLDDVSDTQLRFRDVSSAEEYYKDIDIVADYGIMNGVSKNEFYPENEIKFEEAVKTLIKIFGYTHEAKYYGGYPQGYITVAANLGIDNKVNASFGSLLTKTQLAQMIYNSLDINVMTPKISSNELGFEKDSETVLEYVMGLEKETGTMTSNLLTDLYTPCKGQNICVNNKNIYVEDNKKYVNELIGHKVVVYYNDDGLIWACKDNSDNSLIIDGADIESFNDGVLTYDNGKLKKIVIESGTPVIYNGLAVSEISEDMFMMQGGKVEVIKNKSNCDAIIIKNYKTYYVSGIDKDKRLIYNKLASELNDESIDVDENENSVIFRNAEGYTDFDSIAVGNVLSVAKNEYAIDIIISTENKSGKVTSIDKNIYINDKEYELSKEYAKSRFFIAPSVGNTVKAYLDVYGNIAWIDFKTVENMGGYITRIYDDEDGKSKVKIFTLTGISEVYDMEDKISYIDENNVRIKINSDILKNFIETGYINYSLSENAKINKIIIPLKTRSDENRLYEMVNDSMSNIRYKSTFNCFSGKAYIGNNTKIFIISDDNGNTKLKLSDSSIFTNSTDYNISAYATNPDSMYADVIICRNDTDALINELDYAAVVIDIKISINADDEAVKKVTVYQNGKKNDISSIIIDGVSSFDIASDVFGSSDKYIIKKGDIIRWSTDFDGNVDNVQLLYSPYIPNPSGGHEGYLAGVKNDKYMVSSTLIDRSTGTNNIYNATSNSQTRTDCNPFSVNSGTVGALAFRFYQSGIRTMLGWTYSRNDEFVTLTTQDLSTGEKFSANGIPDNEYTEGTMTGVYIIDSIKYQRFNTTYIKYNYKGGSYIPNVRVGELKDIKDYKSYGGDCSRVICMMKSGEPHQMIIIDMDI